MVSVVRVVTFGLALSVNTTLWPLMLSVPSASDAAATPPALLLVIAIVDSVSLAAPTVTAWPSSTGAVLAAVTTSAGARVTDWFVSVVVTPVVLS